MPRPGCREEVPGAPEIGRVPGAEDATPSGASNALEACGSRGAAVLEGEGHVDGGGLGAGMAPPRDPAVGGGAATPVDEGAGARQGGITIAALGAGSHGSGRHRAGAGGRKRSRGGRGGGQLED